MKIVNMEIDRSSDEEKSEQAVAEPSPYPYGLCLNLCEDEMEKLGIDEPWPVDTVVTIQARAVVTATRDNESIGGKDVGMSIQITNLGLEAAKKSAAKTMYGDDAGGEN